MDLEVHQYAYISPLCIIQKCTTVYRDTHIEPKRERVRERDVCACVMRARSVGSLPALEGEVLTDNDVARPADVSPSSGQAGPPPAWYK